MLGISGTYATVYLAYIASVILTIQLWNSAIVPRSIWHRLLMPPRSLNAINRNARRSGQARRGDEGTDRVLANVAGLCGSVNSKLTGLEDVIVEASVRLLRSFSSTSTNAARPCVAARTGSSSQMWNERVC